MTALMVHETYVNDTEGHMIGESDWYEAWTGNRGELSRALRKEYGGCISRMYRDVRVLVPEPQPGCEQAPRGWRYGVATVGWVFSRRERFEDARGNDPEKDYYTREVWVEVRQQEQETAQ